LLGMGAFSCSVNSEMNKKRVLAAHRSHLKPKPAVLLTREEIDR
jgi:hypothetical protein